MALSLWPVRCVQRAVAVRCTFGGPCTVQLLWTEGARQVKYKNTYTRGQLHIVRAHMKLCSDSPTGCSRRVRDSALASLERDPLK